MDKDDSMKKWEKGAGPVVLSLFAAAIPSGMHSGIMKAHNNGVCEEAFALSHNTIGWTKADELRDTYCGSSSVENYGVSFILVWLVYWAITYGLFRAVSFFGDN